MDDKKLVVKSNKLNEARYRLSVQEQRIILVLLAEINENDNDIKSYTFYVKDFIALLGITGKGSYGHLKKVTKALLTKVFTIPEPDGDLQISWLNSVKYYDAEGRFDVMFSLKLKPYLLRLKKEFTRYQVHNVIRLKSSYSVRIYELLKQYQSIGSRYFELTELRLLLGLPGDKLKLYGDFKRRVLDIGKKELVNSDITFNYKPIKHVRKVVGVQFEIYANKEVIKRSKKKKKKIDREKKNQELQLELDFKNKEMLELNGLLKILESDYPEKYAKLKKQAKKRLKSKNMKSIGIETTIKLKMKDLLRGFIEKETLKFKSQT